MFGHRHYVPILKSKAGERWAIDHLKAGGDSDFLTPLFEIHKHNSKGSEDHAHEVCDSLVSAWGTDQPFFLDTIWLHGPNGDAAIVSDTLTYARSVGLQAIPVVRVTYDTGTLDAVRDAHEEDSRGVLLRLFEECFSLQPTIDTILNYLQLKADSVDLLMDYRRGAMNLGTHVGSIPYLQDWRTLIAASGTFPRSLANLPLNTWHSLPRHCWKSWYSEVSTERLARKPSFGDYTVRDPGPPASGGAPSTNVRYTKEDNWFVRVGRKLKDGYASDMYDICGDLIARPEYDGAAFSAGDKAIFDTGNRNTKGPGAAQQWVQWAVSHHLAFVTQQLRTASGL